MVDTLAPLQVCVGVSCGEEAAIHATRHYINSMLDSHVIKKLDFANAFSTLRRDCLLEAASRESQIGSRMQLIQPHIHCNTEVTLLDHVQ